MYRLERGGGGFKGFFFGGEMGAGWIIWFWGGNEWGGGQSSPNKSKGGTRTRGKWKGMGRDH